MRIITYALSLHLMLVALTTASPVDDPRNHGSSEFAICAVVKNQYEDLREWIGYHREMGAGKMYIYDDHSSAPLLDVLLDYVQMGFVEYTYLTKPKLPNSQLYSYSACMKYFGEFHTWIAFIDVDEFIVVKEPGLSIPDVLKKYESFGALTLQWMFFGSSGHVRRPEGGVLQNYWQCCPNFHVKTIVNTKCFQDTSIDPHHFELKEGCYAVDTDQNRVEGPFNIANYQNDSIFSVMYLNHYLLKSWEDYQAKMSRGAGDGSSKDAAFFHNVERDIIQCNRTCPILKASASHSPALR